MDLIIRKWTDSLHDLSDSLSKIKPALLFQQGCALLCVSVEALAEPGSRDGEADPE